MNKTLVILPGWGGTKKSWQKFIDLASSKISVKCIELPCFGDEPCPENVWGIREYAGFVKEKLNQIDGETILLGHSFGGQVASYLCAVEPKIISRLILSGPAIIRPKKHFKKLFFLIVAKAGKKIFKLPILNKYEKVFKKIIYKLADSPDYNKTAGVKRDIFNKVINENYLYLLKNISIPTLIIWGSKDSYVPVKYSKVISREIPKSNIVIIKNEKHGLHIDIPEKLFNIIIDFVK